MTRPPNQNVTGLAPGKTQGLVEVDVMRYTPGPWVIGNTDPLLFGIPQGNGTEPLGFGLQSGSKGLNSASIKNI